MAYNTDMNRDELIEWIVYLWERIEEMEASHKENDRRISELTDWISGLTEMLRQSNEHASVMTAQLSELVRQLREKDRKISSRKARPRLPGRTCSVASPKRAAGTSMTLIHLCPIRMRKRVFDTEQLS